MKPQLIHNRHDTIRLTYHRLLHGQHGVENAKRDLIHKVVEAREHHGEHGLEVGVDLLGIHVHVGDGPGHDKMLAHNFRQGEALPLMIVLTKI